LSTQAAAHEPDGLEVVGVGVGVGVGEPPPLPPPLLPPTVNGWNACVKAPFDWLTPLQVDDA
jgi:hypothetical protein